MIKIDNEIKAAIRQATEKSGTISHFSKEIGVAHSTVLFWLSGKTRSIDMDVWLYKLYPYLKPYLRKEKLLNNQNLIMASNGSMAGPATMNQPRIYSREIPVINIETLKKINHMFVSLYEYSLANAIAMKSFACDTNLTYIALQTPPDRVGLKEQFKNVLILVSLNEIPSHRDRVIAFDMQSGEIIFRKFHITGNKVTLKSINGEDEDISWDCLEKRGVLDWIYPIQQITFDVGRDRKKH